MAHALAAHLCAGNFNAALVAHHALVAHALISAAVAFPVLGRPEYAFAEQSVNFRLERAVIYGLGFFDLSVRPFPYFFRGCKANLYSVKICQLEQCFSLPSSAFYSPSNSLKSASESSSSSSLKSNSLKRSSFSIGAMSGTSSSPLMFTSIGVVSSSSIISPI